MELPGVGMLAAGAVALLAGLLLARPGLANVHGAARVILLGPLFEATALAIFAAEHFLMARALATIVPRWLPAPLFWTYFVGIALLAAAVSLIAWRCIQWSAPLLALLFLVIVVTIDLPALPKHMHERLFWTLTFRETAFAGGAMVLAGSWWIAKGRAVGRTLAHIGRAVVALTFLFYGMEHFLFPRFVPGVPLEKLTPAWWPAPALLAYVVGATLLVAGAALFFDRTRRIAAADEGVVLLLLTFCFYLPILLAEIHTPFVVEGINYVGDTMLFAGTALLAGFDAELIRLR